MTHSARQLHQFWRWFDGVLGALNLKIAGSGCRWSTVSSLFFVISTIAGAGWHVFNTGRVCSILAFFFFLCNERNDHSILNIAKVYLHLNKWKEATQCIANQKCVCDIRAKKSTSAQFCRNSRMLFKIVYIFNFFFFLIIRSVLVNLSHVASL